MPVSIARNKGRNQRLRNCPHASPIREGQVVMAIVMIFAGLLRELRRKSLFLKEIWLGAESNRRHEDFQSSALPTELPSLKSFVIKYLQTNCFHRQRFVGNNV
jgi:hypothetical protein